MTYHLFLDDERSPVNVTWMTLPDVPWHIVRNYEEFTEMVITKGAPLSVSFDHDLADEHYAAMLRETNNERNVDYGPEMTGYECAKWLVYFCEANRLKFPDYTVHSMNPIGAKRIHDFIAEAKKHLLIMR